jgi:acetyl esterase/lipase
MGPSAEAVEDIFVKNWATRIPGLTILNVDFSLAPENPFPTALQEVLDLYLWLVSGCPSVRETLSFNPCEVIVSGDSSGGNIAAALILSLNDLRLNVLMMESLSSFCPNFLMPKSLVLFFAKLSIDLEVYPSTLLSILDPLVNPFFMIRAAEAYIPFFLKSEDGSKKMIDSKKSLPQEWIHDTRYQPVTSYYLSPLHYTSFQGITDVSLHVMAYNFDPFLDESILFAKKWRGPVSLQVLDGLCHAGFYFKLLNSRASQASKAAVEMIRRSL